MLSTEGQACITDVFRTSEAIDLPTLLRVLFRVQMCSFKRTADKERKSSQPKGFGKMLADMVL